MSRVLLVVDSDFEALEALSSKLRARGLELSIANEASALGDMHSALPEAVIVAARLLDDGALRARFMTAPALASAPIFTLHSQRPTRDLRSDELDAGDADDIAHRMLMLAERAAAVHESADARGDLRQLGIWDLLQLLNMKHRSGSVSITTPTGAGEIRLVQGEIVDAVYRRLEGEKALYRLLAETDGLFSFAGGAAPTRRRIVLPTHTLLHEGMRQIDETGILRTRLRPEGDAFLALGPVDAALAEAARRVLLVLRVPRTVDELLDEVPLADLDVLSLLSALLDSGHVRRIASGQRRVELADAERLGALAESVKRAARPGFRAPARVAIAASPRRLVTLSHAVRRIADSLAPSELLPSAPIPQLIATLRLAEGAELGVIGLPLVEAYAPLWPMVLPSCAAVARLGAAAAEILELACSQVGVPIVDATALLLDGDESDPRLVAGLLCDLLELAVGG